MKLGTVSAASRRKLFKGTQHLFAVRVERETKGPAEGKVAQMIQKEAYSESHNLSIRTLQLQTFCKQAP